MATFALNYGEAFKVISDMCYAKTASWDRGNYVNTDPGVELRERLKPYLMTPEKWRERIAE